MKPPVGSVAVKYTEGVGFAVYVQTDVATVTVVWSRDMLHGALTHPLVLTRDSIADYGAVVYEPAPETRYRPSGPFHPSDWA